MTLAEHPVVIGVAELVDDHHRLVLRPFQEPGSIADLDGPGLVGVVPVLDEPVAAGMILGAGGVAVVDSQPDRHLLELPQGGWRRHAFDLVELHVQKPQRFATQLSTLAEQGFVHVNGPAFHRSILVRGCRYERPGFRRLVAEGCEREAETEEEEQAGNNFPIPLTTSGCHWSYSTSVFHQRLMPGRRLAAESQRTGRVRPVAPYAVNPGNTPMRGKLASFPPSQGGKGLYLVVAGRLSHIDSCYG